MSSTVVQSLKLWQAPLICQNILRQNFETFHAIYVLCMRIKKWQPNFSLHIKDDFPKINQPKFI